MSNPGDPGEVGQYRIVPLINGKFQVEQYGYWDDSVEWPYWGMFENPFNTKKLAEAYILKKIEADRKAKADRAAAEQRQLEFNAANPPYVYPPPENE